MIRVYLTPECTVMPGYTSCRIVKRCDRSCASISAVRNEYVPLHGTHTGWI